MHYLLIFLLTSIFDGADDRPDLAIDLIPIELRFNANIVTRYKKMHHHIRKLDSRETYFEHSYSMLQGKGSHTQDILMYYEEGSSKLYDIDIRIYDAKGSLVKKVRGKEMEDYSATNGFTMVSNTRYKHYKYTSNNYPYTISYSYSLKTKNTLDLGYWQPASYGRAVEHDEYWISSDVPFDILTKVQNTEGYDIDIDLSTKKFVAKNLRSLDYEPLQPSYGNIYPLVRICPKQFNYENYEGNVTSWEDFGKWKYQLISDRQEVSPQMISELEKIIDVNDSNEAKIDKIYRYMADNMRYVSIQLGIGGLRPFAANKVHDLKYGDCKGLSNYAISLLNYFGVEALYTVIENNSNYDISFDPEIPDVYQGNHVIACVPNEGDTLWLECTSKTYPTGFIGGANHNRKVLLVAEDGGKIARTKKYTDRENKKAVTIDMHIDDALNVNYLYYAEYENLLASSFFYYKNDAENEARKKFSKQVSTKFSAESYGITYDPKETLVAQKAEVNLKKPLKLMAGYLMLPINIMASTKEDKVAADRLNDLYIKNGNYQEENIAIHIPEGYSLVNSDSKLDLKNRFGEVSLDVEFDGQNSIVVRKIISRNSGVFSKSFVSEYNDFIASINKSNAFQVTLKKL